MKVVTKGGRHGGCCYHVYGDETTTGLMFTFIHEAKRYTRIQRERVAKFIVEHATIKPYLKNRRIVAFTIDPTEESLRIEITGENHPPKVVDLPKKEETRESKTRSRKTS